MAQELSRKEDPRLNTVEVPGRDAETAYTILPSRGTGGITPYPTAAEPKPVRESRTVSDVISDVDLGTLEPVEEDLSLGKREQALIEQALKKHAGNRRKAAEELGISERTIYRKIKEYSLLK